MGSTKQLLSPMTLWEALLDSTVTEDAAELLRLGPTYDNHRMSIVGAAETEFEQSQNRFCQMREHAEKKLRERLETGNLLATGQDSQDPFAPRQRIPGSRWAQLKMDYDRSAVEIGMVWVIEVEITKVGGLHIDKKFQSARLAGVDLSLSRRSFDLLLTLAEGASKEFPFVSLEDLGKKHFDTGGNDKAIGQGIAALRIQLGKSIGRKMADQLVSNVRGQGYCLKMQAAEITIND